MMRIKFSPQRSDHSIEYRFNGETITANLNGETDIIDISTIEQYPIEENMTITKLPINPIISIQTINGIKHVELLKFHKQDAPESERFGFDWQEV